MAVSRSWALQLSLLFLSFASTASSSDADANWDRISTSLLEPARVGERQIVVKNCKSIVKGSRLRLAFAAAEEEEGAVEALECPSPGLSVKSQQQQQQPAVSASALLPEQVVAATDDDRLPGVVTLAAGLLFEHAAEVSVRGTEPLSASAVAASAACPTGEDGRECSGRGACELASCSCREGYEGRACEVARVAAAGEAEAGQVHAAASCPKDCGSRGKCQSGVCLCQRGFSGDDCTVHSLEACPQSCNNRGSCMVHAQGADPVCMCHSKYVGVTCLQEVGCAASCNASHNGLCVGGACQCYQGFAGDNCATVSCPDNCTAEVNAVGATVFRGRCSATAGKCVCREGYYGVKCEHTCPSRCYGHGECSATGECICRDGYTGVDCGTLAPILLSDVLLIALQGYSPVMLVTLVFLIGVIAFCSVGYVLNRSRGRFGTAAVPLWDYYAKTWRNAPLFEPIFHVSASTQTPTPAAAKGR